MAFSAVMEMLLFLYISVACEKENPALVAMLLNHGASVNKSCIQGWTALHESVCRNNVEICEMLMKAGAKVSLPNKYGITPIFVAAQSGKVDALRMLLKNGTIFLYHLGCAFLSVALWWNASQRKFLSILSGADLNSQATDGATALYEACKNGHDDIVEFLLSQNADANKAGKTGLLPIHIAAQRGKDGYDLTILQYNVFVWTDVLWEKCSQVYLKNLFLCEGHWFLRLQV